MRCATCGIRVSLPDHQEIRIDELWKEYLCSNGHKTTYKRYGHTIEINGKKSQVKEFFNLAEAQRLETNKKRNTLKINALRTTKNRH